MEIRRRHWDRHGTGGLSFTELGFGTAPLGNLYRAISDDEADAILARAWDAGIRYFDTAPLYGLGLSETRLNRFLRDKPRDDYVLSTKVGRILRATSPDKRDGFGKWFDVPARNEVYDYGYDAVMRSLEFSLERLGTHRVDILYGHDLDLTNHGSRDALDARMTEFLEGGHEALVKLRSEGVIGAFGLGVNEWQPCKWLAERGDPDIFLLAGRYTLLEQASLDTMMPLCVEKGIGVVIGGPYNSGILATGPRPGAYYNYDPAPQEVLDRVAKIEAACTRHGVRLVDAAFQFPLRHPAVVSIIPGGQSVDEMASNLKALNAEIPAQLWADLKSEGLLHPDAPVE
ncbi:aldo/keto reductase [Ponticoccus sp. SC2-23]|uniref:aldo/keto reductase n=1 Tax=Alexandriicola marinus TaxID=2081710 RepID=UPI000FD78E6F|nr:aldo/keto reductase [Alexandriicola marinus]MBM1220875.1 aldo/keto reductase [Ponticoccus sp. SC6-9]MBM1225445.1 aldo/keto reductase [Ponticoccus sp. SC6-15]MBM1227628.1 aldo/keto reductase [Ponticoccus sp. SC6-38]MBM1234734.1 aldo/keto reductase [Ponticoccus sp. SC6-45]MBM1238130.1 aldo/keto reductase [Ponticoccus sp. SC6-49]MBM1244237.1 aldo/keto reductase [Ponticoccus sp. SC2-64]MBM1248258.1 aldo/keto reductase [Ponticoccus sp. SC6-42]MBM1252530.1 aldo/keto reductase [Ponticoccus sp. 